MLFTSYQFLAFIFLVFVLYYLIPKRFQWQFLLAASYVFYGVAGLDCVAFIMITTVSTYVISRRIGRLSHIQSDYLSSHKGQISREEKKSYKASVKLRQRKWLLLCLMINIGILAVLKYTNFAIYNVNSVFRVMGRETQLSFASLALPMGISFYTFQTMGYIIDVYRGKVEAERNLGKLALFVSFFPQLVQGPISRFDELTETLFLPHSFDLRTVTFGLKRILWGYFKKMVIADRILVAVNVIIHDTETYQGAFVFVGMMFYALELYADFTGGIDITIGIAEVLGIRVQENFIRPYFSKSIAEYWRRWHISMGRWFTDYIFYPLSVSKPMINLSKSARARLGDSVGKRVPVYTATIVVWFTTGLWHGASWNFIVWGLMNCLVIMISQECAPLYRRFHSRFHLEHNHIYRGFQVIRTLLLMSTLRMFDCYRDVPLTFRMFGNMLTRFDGRIFFDGSLLTLGLTAADYGVLIVGVILMLTVSLIGRRGSVREQLLLQPAVLRYSMVYGLFLMVLVFGAYGVGYDSSQFIYNQF